MGLLFTLSRFPNAFVNDLAKERVGTVFGTSSSVLSTLVFDFGNFRRKRG
jgi:hypothetical protein